jgi:murein DD-endopeptidase MepM/ murein hydrolase activator NlpD
LAVTNDKFTINDITFTVPPTQISIQKEAANWEWQTLRTRNAQKVKSGHGVINISFSAVFVGDEAINDQLRPIVAQLRLTPICYVDNEYLRGALAPEDSDTDLAMALILKSLTLTIQPELKDTIVAHFSFGWFNYLPYINHFKFKRDVFDPSPVASPADSLAWKKLYKAEMGELNGLGSTKYTQVSHLHSDLTFAWKQMFVEREDAIGPLGQNIRKSDIKYESSNNRQNGLALFLADKKIDCDPEQGLIVTSITISFENTLAVLPIVGHQYATYQHIGSIDPVIIIKITAMTQLARQKILDMWNEVEQQANKFRHIPQEHLNISIANPMIGLTGMKTFITDKLDDETVPGQPGTYSLTLRLRETNFALIKEGLNQEYVTIEEVRNGIYRTLNSLINFSGDPGDFKMKPSVSKEEKAALFDAAQSYCNSINDLTSKAKSFLTDPAFSVFMTGMETAKEINEADTSKEPQFLQAKSLLQANLSLSTSFDKLNRNASGASGNDLLSIATSGASNPVLAEFRPSPHITIFLTELRELADKMTLDGRLDLPEFAEARQLANKLGAFRGQSCYPDYAALETVANSENISALDLEPDFYICSDIGDGLKNIIDPGFLQTAINAGKALYTDQADTKSGLGNFLNSIQNYVQDTYQNRFTENSSVKNSLNESLSKIALSYPKKGRPGFSDSSIKRETGAGFTYNNALADPRELETLTASTDSVSSSPLGQTAVQAGRPAITHSTDLSAIFSASGDPLAYTPSEIAGLGLFTSPVVAGLDQISSHFGPRDISSQSPEASKFHPGIDYAVPVGTEVRATADGEVYAVGVASNAGLRIDIQHTNGYVSKYFHLSSIAEVRDPITGNTRDLKPGDLVKAQDIIARSGGANGANAHPPGNPPDPNAGSSTGPHLHFEIRDDNGQPIDPEKVLSSSRGAVEQTSGEGSHFGNTLLAKSLESLESDLIAGQAQALRRALPAFKLYFVEEDVEDRIFGFDDFFSYNAVKSFRVVRSRKIPADLCVIELTNISGILSNRKFREFGDRDELGNLIGDKPRDANGNELEEPVRPNPLNVNTAKENPLASIMLQEGTKVLLRFGYSNDPEKLDNTFVGQIVEVEFNETDDLVTIVCQSYATELVQQVKGLEEVEKKSGFFLGFNKAVTPRLLSDLLQEPEVLHFGRWIRSRANGTKFGIFSTDKGSNTNLDLLTNRYEWIPRPQDDNIFAPVVRSKDFPNYFSVEENNSLFVDSVNNILIDSLGGNPSFHLNFLEYYIYKTTIWDIFKEMELRHPGCIASPVPYMDSRLGPRMTMFFGIPNQLYFSRDPSFKEQRRNNLITSTIEQNSGALKNEINTLGDLYGIQKDDSIGRLDVRLNALKDMFLANIRLEDLINPSAVIQRQRQAVYQKQVRKTLAEQDKSIKPFRDYHILTSHNHIIQNNIRSSSLDTYNSVAIEYSNGTKITGIGLSGLKKDDVVIEGDKLTSTKKGVFRLRADAGLPDEEVQEAYYQYPSCMGDTMAEFYALGSLKTQLRDIYKGELVIIGNPSIKPYDVCYVFDEYTDMVGPVEVEQVVHYFSQETGFISEITPDMCVSINEWTTMGTMDVLGLAAENIISTVFNRPIQKHTEGQGITGASEAALITTGVSLPIVQTLALNAPILAIPVIASNVAIPATIVGAFIISKLVQYTKLRHPIALSPLLYKGRPMNAALGSKVVNGTWWTNILGVKKWLKDGVDGVGLVFNDIGDQLVFSAGTGSMDNIGVNTIPSAQLFGK